MYFEGGAEQTSMYFSLYEGGAEETCFLSLVHLFCSVSPTPPGQMQRQ